MIKQLDKVIENPTVDNITDFGNDLQDLPEGIYNREIGKISIEIKDIAGELDPMFGSMTEAEASEKLTAIRERLVELLPSEETESLPRAISPEPEVVIETEYDDDKKMSLETKSSKLLTRLKQVNPTVTLEVARQCLYADKDVKEKIVEQYGVTQTESWIAEVRALLDMDSKITSYAN